LGCGKLHPALESVYGSVTRKLDDGALPGNVYIGCGNAGDYCRDGVLGCQFDATSQPEVAKLSKCELALRDLTLSGPDVTDLSPLSKLRQVRGKFTLGTIPGDSRESGILESAAGLEALQTVGQLVIGRQPWLRDLHALSGLTKTGSVQLSVLDSLVDLTGLEHITGPVGLHLWKMPALKDLRALSKTVVTGGLEINACDVLEDLSGLSVAGTGQSIAFKYNPKLTSLAGLSGLETANLLTVEHCDAIRDLSGLDSLREASTLELSNNAGLLSLDGVPNLRKVESFFISDNASLVSLRGLDGLAVVSYQVSIDGNSSLPQCEVARLAARLPNINPRDNGASGTCEP
jgi:hypothetical protein